MNCAKNSLLVLQQSDSVQINDHFREYDKKF